MIKTYMLKGNLIPHRVNENMLQYYSYFIARYFYRFSYTEMQTSLLQHSLYAKQRWLRRQSTRSYLFHNNDTASSEMERKHGSGKIAFTEQIIRK